MINGPFQSAWLSKKHFDRLTHFHVYLGCATCRLLFILLIYPRDPTPLSTRRLVCERSRLLDTMKDSTRPPLSYDTIINVLLCSAPSNYPKSAELHLRIKCWIRMCNHRLLCYKRANWLRGMFVGCEHVTMYPFRLCSGRTVMNDRLACRRYWQCTLLLPWSAPCCWQDTLQSSDATGCEIISLRLNELSHMHKQHFDMKSTQPVLLAIL